MKITTPEKIESLLENEIFVFGSNLNGNHAGGAAKLAQDKFGAEDGVGEGMTGQSYAFPTLDKDMEKVSVEKFIESIKKLYACAIENSDKNFLITKVGCGIAGFDENEVRDMFLKEQTPPNVALPIGWEKIVGYKAFNADMTCRDFKYEVGKTYRTDKPISLCHSGFHFCPLGKDVYCYYDFGSPVAEVEALGDCEWKGDKIVTSAIKIVRILSDEEARFNIGYRNIGLGNVGNGNTGDVNTGNWNKGNWNTGDGNTGNWNNGNWNNGNWNNGNWNNGNWNNGNWNKGDWNTGDGNKGNGNKGNSIVGDSITR